LLKLLSGILLVFFTSDTVKMAFSMTSELHQHSTAISEFWKQILHVVSKTYLRGAKKCKITFKFVKVIQENCRYFSPDTYDSFVFVPITNNDIDVLVDTLCRTYFHGIKLFKGREVSERVHRVNLSQLICNLYDYVPYGNGLQHRSVSACCSDLAVTRRWRTADMRRRLTDGCATTDGRTNCSRCSR